QFQFQFQTKSKRSIKNLNNMSDYLFLFPNAGCFGLA
ncbi:MAG: hypothetical protein ACI9KN_001287, partial [Gammaproteobacteria bacterium]